MIQARYRTDYAGEFVILETKWSGGKKSEQREWIPNPIENHHLSGRAACIGSTLDLKRFDYTRLERHRGGLLGSKKLQTYGTGTAAQQMRLDFAVETASTNLTKILETKYQANNIVYTSPRYCVAYPGEFYLIPLRPRMVDLAIVVYLAAFDEHKEIFMLGYTDETDGSHNEWIAQITSIFAAYTGTKFYLIGEPTRMPDAWVSCPNTQTLDYLDFISYCDVSQ
jgi:hypothetical protein